MPTRWMMIGALIATTFVFGSAASAASFSDAWLTTKTKLAIASAIGTTAAGVNVDTVDGVVTLHGAVATEEEKERAERAAQELEATKHIRSLLQVVPPERAAAIAKSDGLVEKQVSDALADETALRDSELEVASVHAGTVLLAGRAASPSDHERAVELAGKVPGVVAVHSEVQSAGVIESARREGQSLQQSADEATEAVVATANDAWIVTAVKTRLLAQSHARDLDVDAENGVVTLRGSVPDEAERESAETLALQVEGVDEVVNELDVREEEEAE